MYDEKSWSKQEFNRHILLSHCISTKMSASKSIQMFQESSNYYFQYRNSRQALMGLLIHRLSNSVGNTWTPGTFFLYIDRNNWKFLGSFLLLSWRQICMFFFLSSLSTKYAVRFWWKEKLFHAKQQERYILLKKF